MGNTESGKADAFRGQASCPRNIRRSGTKLRDEGKMRGDQALRQALFVDGRSLVLGVSLPHWGGDDIDERH